MADPIAKMKSSISLERQESMAILRLGDKDNETVILTEEKMAEFQDHLKQLQADPPKGLIITGSTPDMFSVGVDVRILSNFNDAAEATALAKKGQDIFKMLAGLPFLTIAAISGPAVGGACELALACDYRLITSRDKSVIGLPEVRLGIIPGFGGTQRLPRLIGLPKALELLLSGKILKPLQALRLGLVDEVVTYESLEKRAKEIIRDKIQLKRTFPSLLDRTLTSFSWGRKFVTWSAARKLKKASTTRFPAPFSILASAYYGMQNGMEDGFVFEAKELGKLVVSDEAKGLTNLFFLAEASKKIGKMANKAASSFDVLIAGANETGTSVAGLLAAKGHPVVLQESDDEHLKKGLGRIRRQISKLKYATSQEKSFALNRIETTSKSASCSAKINFVLDASAQVKKPEVFTAFVNELPEDLLVAVTPSKMSVTEIASPLPSPERIIGMRFTDPADKVPFVEIIPGKKSSDKSIVLASAFANSIGKFPVIVKDLPGFLAARLQYAVFNEADYLISDGYYPGYIDGVLKAFGMPYGLVKQMDKIGLETVHESFEFLRSRYKGRFNGPLHSKALVDNKRTGKDSGSGYYDYSDGKEFRFSGLRPLLKIENVKENVKEETVIQERIWAALLLEALRCLEEGVAGTPGEDAAKQIDLASIFGAGFPAFRGGILFYAARMGLNSVEQKLAKLAKDFGPRFKTLEIIKKQQEKGKTFY